MRPEEAACVGDDLPDVPLLEQVGLAVAVANALPAVRNKAHFVTQASGGMGAVREVCELIIASREPGA